MRVLVTGATGFIGSHVVAYLLANVSDVSVIALSRNVEKAKAAIWYSRVRYESLDLNGPVDRSILNGCDLLIHLAWDGLPNYNSDFHLQRNFVNDYIFLKDAIDVGVQKIVVTGTCFEYGMRNGKLSEGLVPNPVNYYGIAKDTLRRALELVKKNQAFKFNWIRLFYTYGRGQNRNSFFSQLSQALDNNDPVFNMSGGEQLRDYLPVEKVAEYIVKIAMQQEFDGIVNCCSNHPMSMRAMAERFIKQSGKEMRLNLGYYPYSDLEPFAFWGDDTLLKKILSHAN